MDTEATVAQAIRLFDAGCDYVRITAQGPKEASNLKAIKVELHLRGYTKPLIADIHYSPKAAEIAAAVVEKVRINPGNYIGPHMGKITYTDKEYREELEIIYDHIKPLLEICRQYGTALRIGSNHGSLSKRILSRYGDTPEGMVASAIEFIEICEDLDFDHIVLSMKSSNPRIMIEANRLLAMTMLKRGKVYPVHLGVTEAGDGEDGRIKSAAGIGALLAEGIGDTIRVSLTEEPEAEIPVASILKEMTSVFPLNPLAFGLKNYRYENFQKEKFVSNEIHEIGGMNPPLVIGQTSSADIVILSDLPFRTHQIHTQSFPSHLEIARLQEELPIVIHSDHPRELIALRAAVIHLRNQGMNQPIIIKRSSYEAKPEKFITESAAVMGPAFQEGLGQAIWLENPKLKPEQLVNISFSILQSVKARISRTEYIACPSCGRTLFNIQPTLRSIKERTSHLKGLTIAVMGCIVNGPGEMAGADYGYVGAGRGKITLYKGHAPVKRNIPEEMAVDELIDLIRQNGDWIEP
jgi:(E)-4-hydroxy-3-methylbut-2-enyl-diphosphate synthase